MRCEHCGHPFMPGDTVELQLGLALVTWSGSYRGVEAVWLRRATIEGKLLPTGHECAIKEQEKATVAEQKATVAEQRAEKLAARLREMRINPEDL